ncbi:MAG: hypothetical protein ACI9XU_001554, partial [Arenicella sp.]
KPPTKIAIINRFAATWLSAHQAIKFFISFLPRIDRAQS